jgi:hypothetical protein
MMMMMMMMFNISLFPAGLSHCPPFLLGGLVKDGLERVWREMEVA